MGVRRGVSIQHYTVHPALASLQWLASWCPLGPPALRTPRHTTNTPATSSTSPAGCNSLESGLTRVRGLGWVEAVATDLGAGVAASRHVGRAEVPPRPPGETKAGDHQGRTCTRKHPILASTGHCKYSHISCHRF